MKTSEKIKRGLECDCCGECPWLSEDGCMWSDDFAIALIQQLEHDNAQKDERIRQLEREKVNLLNLCEQFGQCVICNHTSKGTNESPCCDCRYCAVDSTDSYWEWRGVEEEKHET